MTLPQNVADALGELEAAHDQRFAPWRNQWQTIRAHLMSQEAEIDELVRALTMCTDRAKRAESRLAAANAMLREIYAGDDLEQPARRNEALDRIQSHLQGAGDEASTPTDRRTPHTGGGLMDELKPCPFCGCKSIDWNTDVGPNDDYYVEWIECSLCHAKADSPGAWNRRTPEQPQ